MNLIEQVAHCIEFGKINKASPYPPELKGQDGADELTQMALENGFASITPIHYDVTDYTMLKELSSNLF